VYRGLYCEWFGAKHLVRSEKILSYVRVAERKRCHRIFPARFAAFCPKYTDAGDTEFRIRNLLSRLYLFRATPVWRPPRLVKGVWYQEYLRHAMICDVHVLQKGLLEFTRTFSEECPCGMSSLKHSPCQSPLPLRQADWMYPDMHNANPLSWVTLNTTKRGDESALAYKCGLQINLFVTVS
jgi:hypothetical protein